MVHDIKKEYYKKFLYEPFPVESSLPGVFAGHLNAEVCAGTIQTKDDCIQYLSWTFFFRRLLKNPSYYGLPEPDLAAVSSYLTQLVNVSIEDLIDCYCLAVEEDNRTLTSLPLGRITSFYYLHHRTVKMFAEKLTSNDQDFESLLWILTRALEFSELPVRHNEEILNQQLNESCRFKVKDDSFDSSHTKTYILLQAHFSRLELPCSDYLTDLKSVMDQCIRVLQAMIDIVAMKGLSFVCLRLVTILQMIIQGRWWDDESVLIVPGVEKEDLFAFYEKGLPTFLPQLISAVEMKDDLIDQPLKSLAKKSVADLKGIRQALGNYPQIELRANLLELEGNKPVNDKFELHFPGESEAHCVQLNCKTDYVLEIGLNKIRSRINVEQRQRAIAPKFNKPKDENWMLILEQRSTNELTAMKRCTNIQANRRSVERLVFTCPEQPGKYVFTLYFLSDCYLGLDQQFDFSFEAVAAASQDEV